MARNKKHPGDNGEPEGLPDHGKQAERLRAIVRASGNERLSPAEKELLWQRIEADLAPAPKIAPMWRRLSAAVVILLLISAGIWGWRSLHRPSRQSLLAFATAQSVNMTGTTTRLMLGNHQQLLLRNNRSSITYRQQGAVQADTQLVTQHLDNGKPAFNTLIVPYGNTASLVLEDGTRVWLNAGSRLVYPAAFAAKKREVFLEGEAYFDVRPSAGQPFSVYTSDLEVKVLGTAFNVTAYRDDAGQQVVLTSGSVALEAHKGPAVHREQKQLAPGNMAAYAPGAGDITVKDVRTEEYVSWKDGHIRALHTPLEDILKKLSRYYNQPIQVNSQQGKETFSGDLDLQKNLTDVLSIVAATTSMQYEKSGNTIILKNKP